MVMHRRNFILGLLSTTVISKIPASIPKIVTGFNTPTHSILIRSNIWSAQIKELLLDELYSMKFTEYTKIFEE